MYLTFSNIFFESFFQIHHCIIEDIFSLVVLTTHNAWLMNNSFISKVELYVNWSLVFNLFPVQQSSGIMLRTQACFQIVSKCCRSANWNNSLRRFNHNSPKQKLFKLLDGDVDSSSSNFQINLKHNRKIVQEYVDLLKIATSGGNEKAVERHTVKNKKLLVNDRLKLLFDNVEDLLEISPLAGLGMKYGDWWCTKRRLDHRYWIVFLKYKFRPISCLPQPTIIGVATLVQMVQLHRSRSLKSNFQSVQIRWVFNFSWMGGGRIFPVHHEYINS